MIHIFMQYLPEFSEKVGLYLGFICAAFFFGFGIYYSVIYVSSSEPNRVEKSLAVILLMCGAVCTLFGVYGVLASVLGVVPLGLILISSGTIAEQREHIYSLESRYKKLEERLDSLSRN